MTRACSFGGVSLNKKSKLFWPVQKKIKRAIFRNNMTISANSAEKRFS
jgi:hypothetical protein